MNAPVLQQALDFVFTELRDNHPPVWRHPHKQAVYDRVCRERGALEGVLSYSRWKKPEALGTATLHDCKFEAERGFYTYSRTGASVWHVNFADPRLFAAYGSALMAQDEWQVLEHPLLGSLREALLGADLPALTREDGVATPVLVRNAPRQCALDVEHGHSNGDTSSTTPKWWQRLMPGNGSGASSTLIRRSLYGNAFQHAALEEVLSATSILVPPTNTHLIAIAGPSGGRGTYTRAQITDVLETAASGFRAAVLQTRQATAESEPVEIHTGWWGCGAFGGHRTLMALLQMLAARIASVDLLVFHIGAEADRFHFDEACAFLDSFVAEHGEDVSNIIREIEGLHFSWGASDGN